MFDHHSLVVWPLPREEQPLFINEPWLTDESICFDTVEQMEKGRRPEEEEDNRRVYVPLDLNKAAFLRRLNHVLEKYGEITLRNESAVHSEMRTIISQIEIYDQVWFVREGEFPKDKKGMITGHSRHDGKLSGKSWRGLKKLIPARISRMI